MADSQVQVDEAAFDELLRLEIEGVTGGPASLSARGQKGSSPVPSQSARPADRQRRPGASLWWRLTHPRRLTAGAAFGLAALATVTHLVTPAAPTLGDQLSLPADHPMPALPVASGRAATFASGANGGEAVPMDRITNIQPMQASTVDCAVRVEAIPQAVAMIALKIEAPCDAETRVELKEGPLQVAVRTDGDGLAAIRMPALVAEPRFQIRVGTRAPVEVASIAREADRYARAILHWRGDSGLELHAFEGDADYGQDGHVWAEAPRTIAHALSGNGGFLTILGDPSLPDSRLAAVYTHPVDVSADISIEVPVTEANCDREIAGRTILSGPDLLLGDLDLTIMMPSCDAVGTIVVLGSPSEAASELVGN
ncbi:MAG: hypothetical protein AAF366_01025 [Pseudomonadota bacterium]